MAKRIGGAVTPLGSTTTTTFHLFLSSLLHLFPPVAPNFLPVLLLYFLFSAVLPLFLQTTSSYPRHRSFPSSILPSAPIIHRHLHPLISGAPPPPPPPPPSASFTLAIQPLFPPNASSSSSSSFCCCSFRYYTSSLLLTTSPPPHYKPFHSVSLCYY